MPVEHPTDELAPGAYFRHFTDKSVWLYGIPLLQRDLMSSRQLVT